MPSWPQTVVGSVVFEPIYRVHEKRGTRSKIKTNLRILLIANVSVPGLEGFCVEIIFEEGDAADGIEH